MWEDGNKLGKILKGSAGNLHRHMLTVEDNAVLIVIGIWGVLQEPALAVEIQRNQAVSLTGWMIGPASIALVFTAQQALGIAGGFHQLGLGNVPWILLRLGQINGNIQISVLSSCFPDNILVNTALANIVGSNTQLVVIVRSQLW